MLLPRKLHNGNMFVHSRVHRRWLTIYGRCEFGVAAYNRALPVLPYLPPTTNTALPYDMILESEKLAYTTFTNIPPVSYPIQNVFIMIHQLALAQTQYSTIKKKALGRAKTDSVSLRLLYDAEYSLLQMSSVQQAPKHTYSAIDVMLTEACQLFLWLGGRDLPYEMKLCDVFVVHLKDALIRVLEEAASPEGTVLPNTVIPFHPVEHGSPVKSPIPFPHMDASLRARQNAILWALHIGTLTTGVRSRPDHGWYSEHFRQQTQEMGLKTLQDVDTVLKLFPSSAHWRWSDIRKLEPLIGD